ncbi:choice-of-anchor I family protein [Tenacibaculum amylolyticum]|uniref:choice-of-anchor I family protein n=1 Tax=Tenacibaculum amylolyticum TaxID=104269 RepID=UPI00389624FE
MKNLFKTLCIVSAINFVGCNDDTSTSTPINTTVNFQYATTINVGGESAAEISTYDTKTQKLFVVNSEAKEIAVYNLKNVSAPEKLNSIPIMTGAPNSISSYNGKVAIALEDNIKQNNGKITVYNTENNNLLNSYTVGSLPDMVTFTKDGNYILCANEGEPNSLYTNDPEGSVSIIDLQNNQVTTLGFTSFNNQETSLENNGFRVFGPNASLAQDVEPEYIAVSDDSKTAWVSLQENNGIAKVNIATKTIEAIYPLGFKDYSIAGNEIDPSNKDDKKELRSVPVYGIYQPDAITYVNINGTGYIISANEGDAREYIDDKGTDDENDDEDIFVNEKRIKKIDLDPIAFPNAAELQEDENLGRLKIALDLGDIDNDGDYDKLYAYGGRSFSIWSENGALIYDSGNSISAKTLELSQATFNDDDGRSDDKGAEPEAVEVLNMNNERYILFVGLERTDQVMVYDITNPSAPMFLTILSHDGDEAPEGLLVIPAADSPNGKDLLLVSNEDSGTVSIYQNIK